MIARFVGGRNLRTSGERTQWESVSNALRGDQDVGHNAVMLNGEHLSGTSEARLYFVGDEKNSVLVENLLHFAKIILRRDHDAALTQNRFRDKGCHIAGGREANDLIDRFRALAAAFLRIVGPKRTIRIGRGSKGDARRIRSASLFPALIASDAQCSPTASMKTTVQCDEFVLAGVKPRQLHCAFDGFRASIAEE